MSTAYRFTPYEYRLSGPTTYLTEAGPRPAGAPCGLGAGTPCRRLGGHPDRGPVADRPGLRPRGAGRPDAWTAASVWALRDANAEHLRTIDTFLEMGKATRRAGPAPPPGPCGRHALGQHHRRRPQWQRPLRRPLGGPARAQLPGPAVHDRRRPGPLPSSPGSPASTAPAQGRRARGAPTPTRSGPASSGRSTSRPPCSRDYVFNANDSYWTPNADRPSRGFCAHHRLRAVRADHALQVVSQLRRRPAGPQRGHRQGKPPHLRKHEHENRVRAAEVMRVGDDLDELCAATGEAAACAGARPLGRPFDPQVGGHPHLRGVHRAGPRPTALWQVPFNAADPLQHPARPRHETNPRPVQAAMAAAIASLRREVSPSTRPGVPSRSPATAVRPRSRWAGGSGDPAGQRHALASVRSRTRTAAGSGPSPTGPRTSRPIAFLDKGRVRRPHDPHLRAYENPRSRWSEDQTKLFSKGKWVAFPFTAAEIRRALFRTFVLRSPRAA